MLQAEVAWQIQADLGESPVWWNDWLYWVDINGQRLHVFSPATEERRSVELPEKTAAVVPRSSGGVVLGLETGLASLDAGLGNFTRLPWPAEHRIVNRFNDGKCDARGRLWIGTLGRDRAIASLFRVAPSHAVSQVISGVYVSNGLCWDEGLGRFYFIDSPLRTIDVFDWDAEQGTIANRRIVARLPESEPGVPDGMTIDAEGRLWVAVFGGHGVHCIDPESGQSLERIHVPAAKTTSCAFGGENLDELYITTAALSQGGNAAAEPLAGSLFVCRPGVKGVSADAFAG